jgi:hypothetical protein
MIHWEDFEGLTGIHQRQSIAQSNLVSLHIDCELSNRSNLTSELFDLLLNEDFGIRVRIVNVDDLPKLIEAFIIFII